MNEQNSNKIKRAQHQYMYPYIFHNLSENSGSPVVNIPTMNKGYEDLKERHCTEVEFVNAVTAGGSVKFLSAV